jgi:diketogulonate reductase-like aldo/keto reductase
LYLIHNPAWGGDIKETWREMRGVKKEGWAKSIGVSKYVSFFLFLYRSSHNWARAEDSFSVDQLKEIIHDSGVIPAVNQIRFHPKVLAESEALLEFHKEHGIVTEGYSPIKPLRDGTSPGLVKVLAKIAKDKGVEPDQVLLAWSKAKG